MRVLNEPEDGFKIAIEFNRKEAEILLAICVSTGGDIYKSPRAVTDQLGEILSKAGVSPNVSNLIDKSLWFNDYRR